MINIIEQIGANRILKIGTGEYIFYSQRVDLDLNTIKSLFSKYRIKSNITEGHRYNFMGISVTCVKIVSDGTTVYLFESEVSFEFSGMSDLIKHLKEFGTENIVVQNNNIQLRPTLQAIDRHNFKTTRNEIVSVGNFMVHFGDFMDNGNVESFLKDLHIKDSKLIDLLLNSYGKILKKTDFENILGYASVNKFHKKVLGEDIIKNYEPMSGATYCIMVNDSPMKLSFNRIDGDILVVDASIAGSFRHRNDLPQFDPHIIFTSRKMPSMPSITQKTKVANGNSIKTIAVHVSILKFSKPQMFKESKFSVDLLGLEE